MRQFLAQSSGKSEHLPYCCLLIIFIVIGDCDMSNQDMRLNVPKDLQGLWISAAAL